jgi:hypothetical protein
MAVQHIPNMTPAISLNGSELVEGVQGGSTVRMTTAQIAGLGGGGGGNVLIQTDFPLQGGPIIGTGTISMAPNGITNDLLDTMPPLTIKANLLSSTTNPTNSSLNDVIDASFGSTRGAVLYRGASGWVELFPGASGKFLKTQGAGSDPVWDDVSTGTIAWGSITGAISSQTDLQSALNAKQPLDADLTQIASITPTDGDLIQRVSGAWTNVTVADLLVDLQAITQSSVDNDNGGGRAFNIPPAGEIAQTTAMSRGALGAIGGAADRMTIFPWYCPKTMTITGLRWRLTVAAAASNMKAVVYSSDINGRPGALIFETLDVPSTTTGEKSASATITFVKGMTYWLGLRMSSGSVSYNTWPLFTTPSIQGGTTINVSSDPTCLNQTLAYLTAAPANWTYSYSDIGGTLAPAIWLTF